MVAPLHDAALELPDYAAPPLASEKSEYSSSLENARGRKWLILAVKSRSASPTSLPLYFEKDVITGRVELDLDKPETIKGVIVSVKGCITVVGQNEESFLDITHDIWNTTLGHPTDEKASPSKLNGKFSWPFTIHLPGGVSSQESKGRGAFALPPSFSERASTVFIDYKIAVTIKRPALKVNSHSLAFSFNYMPITKPRPIPPLRRAAYEQGTPLVGPEGDPEGWIILPAYKYAGVAFDSRKTEVKCKLAIANPLTYSLASPIPVLLRLTSTDTQALDLLAVPSAIRLHLVRAITLGAHAASENAALRGKSSSRTSSARAAFWPSTAGKPETGIRILEGEIDVKKTIKPSFVFPKCAMRYTVELLPFDAPGFVFAGSPLEPLISQPVSIVTASMHGVEPHFYAPPGYPEPEVADYNNVAGMLENGTQIFYHHLYGGSAS
ncbi:hypothetical protein HWV62_2292 [Athelia sp. TMB]|nr:hypothetical protein HWV62_6132 [Athelia sp. TMB]KAF7985709.1 hypothetical protein HWV62_2292 [Athelia sp. TMB]